MTRNVLIKRFILFELLPYFCFGSPQICTVRFSDGVVEGVITQTRNGRDIETFLGIPYAEPPTNELRFKSPVPKAPWPGLLVANRTGIRCPQILTSFVRQEGSPQIQSLFVGEEDCLVVNVYKPKDVNDRLLPVIAWIHSGAFIFGDSDIGTYGPGYLLDRDIVLVTMNYRLNVLGFLSTGDYASPGNYGLKDQSLALRWINRNIAAFGGDPNKVTLGGESAGAASVHLHALSDKSAGLFHRIITHSGTALNPWSFRNATVYPNSARKLAKIKDCPTSSSSAIIECFRNIGVEQLLTNNEAIFTPAQSFSGITWGPTKEPPSSDAFITEYPIDLLAKNKLAEVPFLNGIVEYDGLITVLNLLSFNEFYEAPTTKCRETLINLLVWYIVPTNNFQLVDRVIEFYFQGQCSKDRNVLLDQLRDLFTDGWFIYPQVRTLKYEEKLNKPVYYYNFGYRGTFSRTSKVTGNNADLGPTHEDDMTYLFPRDSSSFGLPNLTLSRTDYLIMDTMVDLWTSFAIDGVPKSDHLTPPNLWKLYPPEENYLLIGTGADPTITLKTRSHEERMEFWQRYAPESTLREKKPSTKKILDFPSLIRYFFR